VRRALRDGLGCTALSLPDGAFAMRFGLSSQAILAGVFAT
jgi:hypothetical protein